MALRQQLQFTLILTLPVAIQPSLTSSLYTRKCNTCAYTHFLEQQNIMQATSISATTITTPPAVAPAMIAIGSEFNELLTFAVAKTVDPVAVSELERVLIATEDVNSDEVGASICITVDISVNVGLISALDLDM